MRVRKDPLDATVMTEIYPIRLYGDPVLRKKALPVRDFSGIQQVAERMIETMFEARGVGLAAPQVGLGLRLFVAAELEVPPAGDNEPPEDSLEEEELEEEEAPVDLRAQAKHIYVMVNPVILEREGLQVGTEGCLSLPGLYSEEVPRDDRVVVEYQDQHGEKKSLEAQGYLARVIQHEIDHLDGVLFFQRLPKDKKQEFLEKYREELAAIQRDAKAFLRELKAGS